MTLYTALCDDVLSVWDGSDSFLDNHTVCEYDLVGFGIWDTIKRFIGIQPKKTPDRVNDKEKGNRITPAVINECTSANENSAQFSDVIFVVNVNRRQYYVNEESLNNLIKEEATKELLKMEMPMGLGTALDLVTTGKDIKDTLDMERKMLTLEVMYNANWLIQDYEIDFSVSCCKCVDGVYKYVPSGRYVITRAHNPDKYPAQPPQGEYWTLSYGGIKQMLDSIEMAVKKIEAYGRTLCEQK